MAKKKTPPVQVQVVRNGFSWKAIVLAFVIGALAGIAGYEPWDTSKCDAMVDQVIENMKAAQARLH